MAKSAYERKANRNVRAQNRELQKDVFGTRFFIRQIQKARADGILYFRYRLEDNLMPERNYETKWYNEFEIGMGAPNKLLKELNNFIITSNFWTLYRAAHPGTAIKS